MPHPSPSSPTRYAIHITQGIPITRTHFPYHLPIPPTKNKAYLSTTPFYPKTTSLSPTPIYHQYPPITERPLLYHPPTSTPTHSHHYLPSTSNSQKDPYPTSSHLTSTTTTTSLSPPPTYHPSLAPTTIHFTKTVGSPCKTPQPPPHLQKQLSSFKRELQTRGTKFRKWEKTVST